MSEISRALRDSFIVHFVLICFFVTVMILDEKRAVETFTFTIVEKEIVQIKKKAKIVINASSTIKKIKKKSIAQRKVFGVKRNSLVSNQGEVVAKIGNTTTKKEDTKVLRANEDDSLPQAAEEFLITQMPRAISVVRPKYPKWAKEQKITGSVIFEILIDQRGLVRQAKLLRSLNPRLDKLAREAILKFKFKPGFIDKKPVPVRIKYAIKYLLES